jgi:C-terminal processing protease CtpA/Prc
LRIQSPVRSLRTGLVFILPFAAACGGGGGGSGFAGSPPPPLTGSDWQQGVFLDASTFRNLCQNPRNGIDPATNLPYLDLQGTTLDENNFLRSYSNDTYLWYDEIVDQDPGLFGDPLVYFEALRTSAVTSSGQPKDRFHFTIPTDEFFQLSQSGVSAGYGVTWALLSATVPREVVVAYTEPNSPATNLAEPLARGARVLTVDGVDVVNGADVDTLNAALFPTATGETHRFEILDPGAQTTRTIQLTSTNVTSAPVQNVSVIPTTSGTVGYMLFNDHILTAESALVDAVNQLNTAGITDLVLDIRYNGGGFLFIASQLAYMIGGPSIAGLTFEELQFNDKHPVTNPVTGEPLSRTPFFNTTTTNQPLPTLNLPLRRVFVLTGPGTCSASESIMNSLRGVDVEVIQVGSTTCGKPYGFYETPNCGTSYFTIQFKGINAKGFGDYTDGFSPANTATGIVGTTVPGCSVGDDFDSDLGDPAEARLEAALIYRETGTCPTPTGAAAPDLNKLAEPPSSRDGVVVKNPWLSNRIVRQP